MKRSWHHWSQQDINYLVDNFQKYTCQQLAEQLNVSLGSVKKKRCELQLKKTPEALHAIYAKPNAGQFSAGHEPLNTKHDHYITMRIDSRGVIYKWIRVAKSRWVQLHVYLWKKAGNEIPEGYILRFKDGNPLNCVLQNIELTPRNNNLQLNRNKFLEKYDHKYPKGYKKQLKKEIALKARESKKVRRATEKRREKKQNQVVHGYPKSESKVYKKIEVDYSKLIAVKVNHKTIIFVKPGTDIEKIKKQYAA